MQRNEGQRLKHRQIGILLPCRLIIVNIRPLPNMFTNQVFYARQLWYYIFGIHAFATNQVVMFAYNESQGKRGQSNVTSLLFHWLKKYLPSGTETLLLFSDNRIRMT